MLHKRLISSFLAFLVKRRNQATSKLKQLLNNLLKIITQHVYLAIDDKYDFYIKIVPNIFEAYIMSKTLIRDS